MEAKTLYIGSAVKGRKAIIVATLGGKEVIAQKVVWSGEDALSAGMTAVEKEAKQKLAGKYKITNVVWKKIDYKKLPKDEY